MNTQVGNVARISSAPTNKESTEKTIKFQKSQQAVTADTVKQNAMQKGANLAKFYTDRDTLPVSNTVSDNDNKVTTNAAGKAEKTADQQSDAIDWQQRFMKNYADNIAIDTSGSKNTLLFTQTVAKRLKDAGFPERDIEVIDTGGGKGILYARLRSPNRKTDGESDLPPIAFLAHIDTVPAKAEEWKIKNDKGEVIQLDPLKLTQVDGATYEISQETDAKGNKKEVLKPLGEGVKSKLFGRGINDDKAMLSALETSFERMAAEGYNGDRDYILLFAGEEETGDVSRQGIGYVFDKRPELLKGVELLINEGGYGKLEKGKILSMEAAVSEKIPANYTLSAKGVSRHSSEPGNPETNPLYTLAQGITNVSKLEFPIELNDVTRNYFEKIAPNETPEVRKAIEALLKGNRDPKVLSPLLSDPYYNAQLRTTCVATNPAAGIANNVVPESAKFNVNCRILPGTPVASVTKTLTDAVNKPSNLGISVALASPPPLSDPSPVDPALFDVADKIAKKYYGSNVSFMPAMINGATDMIDFRNNGYLSYGINFFPLGERLSNMHGSNEWIDKDGASKANNALYDFMTEISKTKLTGAKQPPHVEK